MMGRVAGVCAVVLAGAFLFACGPTLPDEASISSIVENYLQSKDRGQHELVSISILENKKESDVCRVKFEGIFKVNSRSKVLDDKMGMYFRNVGNTLSMRLAAVQEEDSIKGFMVLSYEDGRWQLTPPFDEIFVEK